MLDSLSPISAIMENLERMTVEDVREASSAAVKLIGNANTHMSSLRREKLVTAMNKNLTPLVKEDADFTEAAPNLFGLDFSKQAKDYLTRSRLFNQPSRLVTKGETNSRDPFLKGPLLREGISQGKGRRPQLQLQREPRREAIPPCKPVTVTTHVIQSTIASLGIIPRSIDANPAGWLAHFIANWQLVTEDRWVQNTVMGYETEFVSQPHQSIEPHPAYLNQTQQQLARQEITKLCRKGVVTEVKIPPVGGFVSTLFLAPKKDGGQRPVINLKSELLCRCPTL